ncbi:MAG TPA: peptide chain release factor N(5)-glutamine methyltransferase [Candidatus Paceibacterota bacterium]
MSLGIQEKIKYIDWLMRDKYPNFLVKPKKYLPLIKKDIKRLEAGKPLAYVIGWVDFLGARIDLSYKPLIPRIETEFWVEQILKGFKFQTSRSTILDLCSGSGCIGLAVLKYLPKARVVLADNSPRAVRQINKNLKINKIKKSRAGVIKSDLFKNIKGKFDYILTNPPYIPVGRELPASVKKYEPAAALFGGKDGLDILKRILKEAPAYLNPGGAVFFEFDSGQKMHLGKLAKRLPYRNIDFNKDQYDKWRYGRAKIKKGRAGLPKRLKTC